jgi:hypothetical protein
LSENRPCGTQHQDADHDQQREHLGHRAGEEELEDRLRLEIENAEAMVPSRLCAPPKTTTRKVSTM